MKNKKLPTIFVILLTLTITTSAIWGEVGLEKLAADLDWRGTFIGIVYFLVVPELSEFYYHMEESILANPDPQDPAIAGIIETILRVLEALYLLSILLCGFYLIFLSGSIKGRARVKYMIPRLVLGMVLVAFSSYILKAIFTVSGAITRGILDQNPVKTETVFLDTFNGLIGILASRTPLSIESGHLFLLSAFFITVGIFTVLSMRFILITIFAMAFPFAIFLYFIEITKGIGRRLLEMTFMWTVIQVIIAIIVVVSNIGILFLDLQGDLRILAGAVAALILIIAPFSVIPIKRFLP